MFSTRFPTNLMNYGDLNAARKGCALGNAEHAGPGSSFSSSFAGT